MPNFTAEISIGISGTLKFEADNPTEAQKILDKLDLSWCPDFSFRNCEGEIDWPIYDVTVEGPAELAEVQEEH